MRVTPTTKVRVFTIVRVFLYVYNNSVCVFLHASVPFRTQQILEFSIVKLFGVQKFLCRNEVKKIKNKILEA